MLNLILTAIKNTFAFLVNKPNTGSSNAVPSVGQEQKASKLASVAGVKPQAPKATGISLNAEKSGTHSPFMMAVFPLMSAFRKTKRVYSHEQMVAFIDYVGSMDEAAFRAMVKSILTQLEYSVELVASNNTDLFVEREGIRTLVRTQANARSLINIMVRPAGVRCFQQLSADLALNKAEVGVLITAGKVSKSAYSVCRKNSLFGVAGCDLMRLAEQGGLTNFSHAGDDVPVAEQQCLT
jgi:hypothetical protein